MIKIDDTKIKEYERDLKGFTRNAYPYATRNTINVAAFETQRIARRVVSSKMIERNKFTKQSIQVDKSKTLNVKLQSASVGSIAEYMTDQEFGGIKRKRGAKGVLIPTAFSAGQGLYREPRTRMVRKGNKLSDIQLRRRRGAKNRAQRNKVAVLTAAKSGNKFVYMDLGDKQGIFKIIGGKRKPQVRMIYDLSRNTVTIRKNSWLKIPVDTVTTMIPTIHLKSLEFQLKRFGLFRG